MTLIPGKSTAFPLGDAHFFDTTGRLFGVEADAEPNHPQPICLHVGTAAHRTAIALSVEDAESLERCLAEMIHRRKAVEAKVSTAQNQRARAFFADSDGPLETA